MPGPARHRRIARVSSTSRWTRLALAPLVGAVALAGAPASAQEGAEEAPPPIVAVPEPPDIPEQVKSGETLAEPEVTIKRDDKRTITEYRVNGRLTAVKVETEGFPTYYLVDTDGDGRVDTRRSGRFTEDDMALPTWVLFRW